MVFLWATVQCYFMQLEQDAARIGRICYIRRHDLSSNWIWIYLLSSYLILITYLGTCPFIQIFLETHFIQILSWLYLNKITPGQFYGLILFFRDWRYRTYIWYEILRTLYPILISFWSCFKRLKIIGQLMKVSAKLAETGGQAFILL